MSAPLPILRVARPSDDLEALLGFYVEGLGLELIGRFEDHEGFDGIMLGGPGQPWHLEFTRCAAEPAGRAPGPEHLLVLYVPDAAEHAHRVERLRRAGFAPVKAFNPYWDRHGLTFEDPDGYRVVLSREAWTL